MKGEGARGRQRSEVWLGRRRSMKRNGSVCQGRFISPVFSPLCAWSLIFTSGGRKREMRGGVFVIRYLNIRNGANIAAAIVNDRVDREDSWIARCSCVYISTTSIRPSFVLEQVPLPFLPPSFNVLSFSRSPLIIVSSTAHRLARVRLFSSSWST